ncbi:uncharacterized protein EV422DRAFT_519755 [Fimicolochytrium jonesii]|uniref:uncharacterized protein n=1 Tax=Fimicolochytrium jonesii TaxID=1396493 RepID=UPI0022FEE5C3|nr:uncharacterized protein EV422DRAFT_519755 [Fimicolochytrium jonesii]KAI8824327.1 hypothetical protein EV422DRAFT_519755 [Fimicolochytrium jonesii]
MRKSPAKRSCTTTTTTITTKLIPPPHSPASSSQGYPTAAGRLSLKPQLQNVRRRTSNPSSRGSATEELSPAPPVRAKYAKQLSIARRVLGKLGFPAQFLLGVLCFLLGVPTAFDIDMKQSVGNAEYVVKDPFHPFPQPQIAYVDPTTLIPHELVSEPHLARLLTHLETVDAATPVPIPVITRSQPHVILDGHHRVAASKRLGLKLIPAWVVDDEDEERDWERTFVRCYDAGVGSAGEVETVVEVRVESSSSSGSESTSPSPPPSPPPSAGATINTPPPPTRRKLLRRRPISTVVTAARAGHAAFGLKGTKHVAVVSSPATSPDGKEVEVPLERVTPRVAWGEWLARPENALPRSGKVNTTELHHHHHHHQTGLLTACPASLPIPPKVGPMPSHAPPPPSQHPRHKHMEVGEADRDVEVPGLKVGVAHHPQR